MLAKERDKAVSIMAQGLGRVLQDLLARGLVDTLRIHHSGEGPFTWWDYRMLAFPKNLGLRIDHVLLTRALASRCRSCSIAFAVIAITGTRAS